jgi:hypothetical protein
MRLTLYQETVINMRLGATALSNTPKSTLVVTKPAQFFAADVQTTMTPHRVTIDARYFAVGRVCMPYACGNSHN